MDTLDWIHRNEAPEDKKVTHPRHTVAHRPEKDEKHRTWITCGGDRLDCFDKATTHTASVETMKLHWNSVPSTKGAKYCTGDTSNMSLMSTSPDAECVRFQCELMPPRIRECCKLEDEVVNGCVHARIKKAWCGSKQSCETAHDDLVAHLKMRDV